MRKKKKVVRRNLSEIPPAANVPASADERKMYYPTQEKRDSTFIDCTVTIKNLTIN